MDTTNTAYVTSTSRLPLPDGTWRVDPGRSEIGFAVKAMWGLVTVRGVFGTYEGRLTARAGGASGELTIDAASLNTRHDKRDRHLRSPDFFDVERHPRIVLMATAVTAPDGGLTVAGELTIGPSRIPLEVPVTVEQTPEGDRLLTGETIVTRKAAGMTWNKLGTIGDVAVLHARLTLEWVSAD
jgi:polyisoprenoid-binding protein YceI